MDFSLGVQYLVAARECLDTAIEHLRDTRASAEPEWGSFQDVAEFLDAWLERNSLPPPQPCSEFDAEQQLCRNCGLPEIWHQRKADRDEPT